MLEDETTSLDLVEDCMISVRSIIEYCDDFQKGLLEKPAETAFESIENMAQCFTLECVKGFVLETAIIIRAIQEDQKFNLPDKKE